MHKGSRAFCLLMAFAAAGTEAVSLGAGDAGQCHTESATVPQAVANHSVALPQDVKLAHAGQAIVKVTPVASFLLASENIQFKSDSERLIALPMTASRQVMALLSAAPQFVSAESFGTPLSPRIAATDVYDADGRKSASLADANERQLLFVKITRG